MVLIFHASDLLFGAEDKAALDWFMAQAKAARPDAIIITGDVTNRARKVEFKQAAAWLSALPAPVSIEVGNHDLPYFNPWRRTFSPHRRHRTLEGMVERPLALPDVQIVPLRTTARIPWRLDWSTGWAGERRVREAATSLGSARMRHRLVACHHPPIEAGTRGTTRVQGSREALAALAAAGATAILTGHVHDPFDIPYLVQGRHIRLIGAGTLSEAVSASAPSYNQVLIDSAGLQVAKISMDGQKLKVRSA